MSKLQVEGFLEGTIPYVKKIEGISYHIPHQQIGGLVESENLLIDWHGYQVEEEGTATIYFTIQGIYATLVPIKNKSYTTLLKLYRYLNKDTSTLYTPYLIQECRFINENKEEISLKGDYMYFERVHVENNRPYSFKMSFTFNLENDKEYAETLQKIKPFYETIFHISFEENIPFILLKPKKKPKLFTTILSLYLLKKVFCLLLRRKNI